MKLTNKTGLPEYVASVLRAAYENTEGYTGPPLSATHQISVTRLIAPAQKVVLEREHEAELEIDIMDTVPALMGQAMHTVLERAGQTVSEVIPEERLTVDYDGYTISGQTDLFATKEGILTDWKMSTVWAFIYGKEEWVQQLNVYRWILHKHGRTVNRLQVGLWCTDWRRAESKKYPDYPDRIVVVEIPVWTLEETQAFIDRRLAAHRAAQAGKPPRCTDQERWARPTTYAVKKLGNKRADAVYEDIAEATVAAGSTKIIETRHGESVRCASWCAAAPFCKQWASDPTNPANAKESAA